MVMAPLTTPKMKVIDLQISKIDAPKKGVRDDSEDGDQYDEPFDVETNNQLTP